MSKFAGVCKTLVSEKLNLVFPLKSGSCVFCFNLFLDELGLTETRGAKKKPRLLPKLGNAQVLGEAEASFTFFQRFARS